MNDKAMVRIRGLGCFETPKFVHVQLCYSTEAAAMAARKDEPK
jgi:hypothetical protein